MKSMDTARCTQAPKRIQSIMTKKTLEQLQEEHSEMCLTATDLGLKVPEDLTIDFDSTEVGSTVVSNLEALIRKHREGLDADDDKSTEVLATDEKKEQGEQPSKSPKKETLTKSTTKAAPAEAKTSTGVEQVAKKAVLAKKAAPAKGAAKTNGSAAPKKVAKKAAFDENAKIAWGNKENPARAGSGRFDRVEAVRKASGKTVKTFLAAKGNPETLANCVKAGLCKVA